MGGGVLVRVTTFQLEGMRFGDLHGLVTAVTNNVCFKWLVDQILNVCASHKMISILSLISLI